jgi:curved DNA-binding protein CbpA
LRGFFFAMSFDYYQILQIKPTATNAEIKAAYRKLAKLFHPDKNPGAEEKFKIIKEAYETLIDSVRRHKYDLKRNYNIAFQTPKTEPVKKQKTYTFNESELKHRQYYQTHYKTKTTGYASHKAPSVKTNYKELTYILISIPAAVALLLILVNIYQIPKQDKTKTNQVNMVSEIKTSESPYKAAFGKNKFDTLSKSYIKISNPSSNDVLVFLRNDSGKVIRHHFIEHNYQLYMEQLPAGLYNLYYYAGNGFTNNQYLFGNIIGNFSRAISVDSLPQQIKITAAKQDSFIVSIPKKETNKLDTLLLKRLFNRN